MNGKNDIPNTFTDKMKWIDGNSTLINFLKSQPGRNLFTLNYVVHDNVNPIARNNPNLLHYYADRTTLQGKVFTQYVAKVHSYMIRFISENNVAEQKLLPHKDNANVQE